MPVRRETLARLQELARAVSQIVDYRVEPLQVATLIPERDLALWGDPDQLNDRLAGRRRRSNDVRLQASAPRPVD